MLVNFKILAIKFGKWYYSKAKARGGLVDRRPPRGPAWKHLYKSGQQSIVYHSLSRENTPGIMSGGGCNLI